MVVLRKWPKSDMVVLLGPLQHALVVLSGRRGRVENISIEENKHE